MASGDPEAGQVRLWTRLSPGGAGATDVSVAWQVAEDPALSSVVAEGEATAGAEGDFTVHVTAGGLRPATTYWYRFSAGGVSSPVGRTRTAPAGPTERLRVGIVCCAHWAAGFFNAYGNLARRDVDVVVHLGDYVYEGRRRDPQAVRLHRPGGRLRTLADYRARHALYKTDPDLRALHAAHPMVAVWDDHEIAGNCWQAGASGHRRRTDGPWEERVGAAVRAYREWMPVPPAADPLRIYRSVRFGDLCELVLTDTRVAGRGRPASADLPAPVLLNRERPLLGDAQWRWLAAELAAPAPPRWRLLASQVVVAPVHLLALPGGGDRLGSVGGGFVVNPGQWDGYPSERDRLLRLLDAGSTPTLVISGDLHSSWVSLLRTPDGRPLATEVTAPAVSAPTFAGKLAPPAIFGGWRLLERVIRSQNEHVRWVDTRHHGYVTLDVTAERIEAEWWHVERVDQRCRGEHCAARLTVPSAGGMGELRSYSSSRRKAATKAS